MATRTRAARPRSRAATCTSSRCCGSRWPSFSPIQASTLQQCADICSCARSARLKHRMEIHQASLLHLNPKARRLRHRRAHPKLPQIQRTRPCSSLQSLQRRRLMGGPRRLPQQCANLPSTSPSQPNLPQLRVGLVKLIHRMCRGQVPRRLEQRRRRTRPNRGEGGRKHLQSLQRLQQSCAHPRMRQFAGKQGPPPLSPTRRHTWSTPPIFSTRWNLRQR